MKNSFKLRNSTIGIMAVFVMILVGFMLLFAACVVQTPEGTPSGDKNTEPENGENVVSFKLAFGDGYTEGTLPFYVDELSNDNKYSDFSAIIRSKSDLINVSTENGYPFFDEQDENYNRRLSYIVRSYDEEFFEENSLILVIKRQNYMSGLNINKLTVFNDMLTLTLQKPSSKGVDFATVLTTYVFLVELENRSISADTGLNVKVIESDDDEYDSIGTMCEAYTLDYAYKNGYLSKDNIRNIAYLYNGKKEWSCVCSNCTLDNPTKCIEGFAATEYKPTVTETAEITDKNVSNKIKQQCAYLVNDTLKKYYKDMGMNIKVDLVKEKDLTVKCSYGTYNGYTAVCVQIGQMMIPQVTTSTIDDIVFLHLSSGEYIFLFKDGK